MAFGRGTEKILARIWKNSLRRIDTERVWKQKTAFGLSEIFTAGTWKYEPWLPQNFPHWSHVPSCRHLLMQSPGLPQAGWAGRKQGMTFIDTICDFFSGFGECNEASGETMIWCASLSFSWQHWHWIFEVKFCCNIYGSYNRMSLTQHQYRFQINFQKIHLLCMDIHLYYLSFFFLVL